MKRPLAVAGFLYLAAQLLATFGPPATLLPLAAIFVLAALAAVRWGGKRRAFLLLCTLIPAAAFGLRFAAQTLWIAPIQSRAMTPSARPCWWSVWTAYPFARSASAASRCPMC